MIMARIVMMVMMLPVVMKDGDDRMPPLDDRSSKHLRRVLARGACDVGQDRELRR